MKTARPNHRRAFTIIELLVSLSILVLIMFTIYATWISILRGSRITLQVAEEAQRSRMAIRCVEDALLTAQNFMANQRYYHFSPETKDMGDHHYLSLVSRLPPAFPGSGLFGDQTVRRVEFEVVNAPGDYTKKHLVMKQMPVLMLTNEVVDPYPITLVRDLTWFVLEFWDPQKGYWIEEWKSTNALPRMMRVTVGWGHAPHNRNEPAEFMSRVIAIPGNVVPPEIQMPQGGNVRPPDSR